MAFMFFGLIHIPVICELWNLERPVELQFPIRIQWGRILKGRPSYDSWSKSTMLQFINVIHEQTANDEQIALNQEHELQVYMGRALIVAFIGTTNSFAYHHLPHVAYKQFFEEDDADKLEQYKQQGED